MAEATPRQSQRDLWLWAPQQAWLFAKLLSQLVLVGVVVAIVRRNFRWNAFFAGLATMLVSTVAVYLTVFTGDGATFGSFHGWREIALWGGLFMSMALGGAAVGRVGRRVGMWEGYLAWLIVMVVIWIHFAKGWHMVIGIGASDTEAYWEFVAKLAPGVRILGDMWERMLGLASVGALLTTVVGSSLAYLLWGDEGVIDMSLGVEWTVARRHLAGRGGFASVTAVVAVIGVALGVAALVSVTAVMSGYQQDVQDKILSTNAHLVVQKYGLDFVEYPEVAADALSVDEVLTASPFTFNEAMLSDGELGVGVLIKGVDPVTAGSVTAIEDNVCSQLSLETGCKARYGPDASNGKLSEVLGPVNGVPSLLVGVGLYRKLGKPLGSLVMLTTPVGIAGARGNAPKRMRFRLGGAFESGMHEFDSRLVYMSLAASQQLMGLGKSVNGIEFRVRNPEQVEIIGAKVMAVIGKYPYRSLDWRDLNLGIFRALKLQKIVMYLVLCSIVIVAAFNIASTLFMAAVEKSREIGVLKSMGCRDVSIMKVFTIEGWLVGSIGTVLGLLLGLAICALMSELDIGIAADVYMVSSLQVRVNPVEVIGTVVAALAISHLATIYPALKAARQSPVDAMRYQ